MIVRILGKMIKQATLLIVMIGLSGFLTTAQAQESNSIRVGVLKSGSVNWEISSLLRYKLDKKHNINIELTEYGSVKALLVALQGDAVDTIVGDWIWVARQFANDKHFVFYPFSTATGGLLTGADKGFNTLADLQGKKIGVAGGSQGKSWLILKAYAKQQQTLDLDSLAEVKFAPPPLVNGLVERGELDASVNFWQFNAKLEEKGFQQLLSLDQMLEEMNVKTPLPVIGWIFPQQFAEQNTSTVESFLAATSATKALLKTSDEAWQQLKPLMKVESDSLLMRLKKGYLAGSPTGFDSATVDEMDKLYQILKANDSKLFPESLATLPREIFWLK